MGGAQAVSLVVRMNKRSEKMIPTKSCPVVFRYAGEIEILAFQHPLAGFQLVKGSIEKNESPQEAALRELEEEAGLTKTRVICDLGIWESGYREQIWLFHICEIDSNVPNEWVHYTNDDGGHFFKFFWQPLAKPVGSEWHEVFKNALQFIRQQHLEIL